MQRRTVITGAVLVFLLAICFLEFVYIPQFGVKPGNEAVPFWQHPPQVIILHAVYLISPGLVRPVGFLLFSAAGLGIWLGFRRIIGSNVLDRPERLRIFSCIRDHPGIHFRELERMTGTNRGTLAYHLGLLVQLKKVLPLEDAGHTRYFENGGRYSPFERKIISSLNNDRDRSILIRLAGSPATHGELMDALRISGPSVSWHMKRLCNNRLVSARKTGKFVSYVLDRDVLSFLHDNPVLLY